MSSISELTLAKLAMRNVRQSAPDALVQEMSSALRKMRLMSAIVILVKKTPQFL